MATAESILTRLGGPAKVARDLNCALTTVVGWKEANYFPDWRRDALIKLASDSGVDIAISEFPTIADRRTRTKVAA